MLYLLFTFLTFTYFTFYGMMCVGITPTQSVSAVISSSFYSLWNLYSGFLIPRRVSSVSLFFSTYYGIQKTLPYQSSELDRFCLVHLLCFCFSHLLVYPWMVDMVLLHLPCSLDTAWNYIIAAWRCRVYHCWRWLSGFSQRVFGCSLWLWPWNDRCFSYYSSWLHAPFCWCLRYFYQIP